MQFNKISQGTPAFDTAAKTFESLTDRFDYDALAAAYNDLKPGEYVSFEYKKGKSAIVAHQLVKRGLAKNGDFELRSGSAEGSETATVIVKRVTDKPAGPLVKAPRKPKADKAAPAPAANASAAAADAKADPKKTK